MSNRTTHAGVFIPNGPKIPFGTYVNNTWHPGNGETRPVTDPADGSLLTEVMDATPDEVDIAVQAAREGLRAWASRSVPDRSEILEAIADRIKDNHEILAFVESRDTGKPISQARSDVAISENYFRYYARAALFLFGDTLPRYSATYSAHTNSEPYGVTAHIVPWNSPLSQLTRGIAPALAVGNVVIIKPSELAPLSSLLFADLIKDLIPPGILSLVQGDGLGTGFALASHPDINHLTFTGSVTTGQIVAKAAADNIVKAKLELGGKSAAIVCRDGDLDLAAKYAAAAVVRNSGQSCSALTRFIVDRTVVAPFEQLLVKRISALTVGRGIDDPNVGPLITQKQRDRALSLVRQALEEGARIACGSADAPNAPELRDGWFMSPTVLSDVTPEMAIARTEIFGPVQSVMVFDQLEGAIAIANGTPYGLAAAVFTENLEWATQLADRLQAGQVHINGFGAGSELPFGGIKHSGYGREKGFEALHGYVYTKTVITHRK